MRVKIVNVFPEPSSIFIYSRLLSKISQEEVSVSDVYSARNGVGKLKRELTMEYDSIFRNRFLKRQIINEKFDILHYADPMVPPASLNSGQVVTVHDNPSLLLGSDMYSSDSLNGILTKKFLKRNFLKYSEFEHVLSVSDYVKRNLIDFGFEGEINTIYLPVAPFFTNILDKTSLRQELGLPQEKTLILSVSTNLKKKNLDLIS